MSLNLDDPTQRFAPSHEAADGRGGPVVPVLVVACHPDPNRMGEFAVLHNLRYQRDQELSRHQPEFLAPDASFGAGLAIAHISRTPLCLQSHADGAVTLLRQQCSAPVRVDGKALDDSIQLSAEQLREGVQLELSDCVLLLLKTIATAPEAQASHGLLGISASIDQVRNRIEKVAGLCEPVLIRGATGTGKELVAQALYATSKRVKEPFISVNLAALQPSLAVAELFGAAKGAYTGATHSREGYFQAADGGTLFLDEVGEASPEVQAMLLRVLETGEILPVGATDVIRVDVRIIAATDADLEKMGSTDAFKLPLLHRLSSYQIFLTPLQERTEDIPGLLRHFLLEQWRQLPVSAQTQDKLPVDLNTPWIEPGLIRRLLSSAWHGNVRQLRNLARQMVIDSRGQAQLRLDPQLAAMLADEGSAPVASAGAASVSPGKRKPSQVSNDELARVLVESRYELQACADALGVSRASVYHLIDRHPTLNNTADLSDEQLQASYQHHDGNLEAMMWDLKVSQLGLRRRLRAMGFRA
ncbi:sigma 54-interacting transcriptional regulator [Aliidiomarina sp. Khilg15.8]